MFCLLTTCSPDDQALLEAAYNADPKPDKAARLAVVEQVSLDEKEVQVSVSRSLTFALLATDKNTLDMVSKQTSKFEAQVTAASSA